MKLTEVVKSLAPTFPKRELEDNLSKLATDASGKYLDVYLNLEKIFKNQKFLSPVAKDIQAAFSARERNWRGNYISIVRQAIETAGKQATVMNTIVRNYRQEEIVRDVIDYPTATIIQFTEALNWYLEFSRAIAIITYDREIMALDKGKPSNVDDSYIKTVLTPEAVQRFLSITVTILKNQKDLEKTIYNLPDMLVTEESANIVAANFNPACASFVGLDGLARFFNPFRWTLAVGRLSHDYKLWRIKCAEQELKLLELRHQELVIRQQGGEPSASLQATIEKYEEEITTLRYKIKQKEKALLGE